MSNWEKHKRMRHAVTNKIAFRTIFLGRSEDVVSIRRYNYVSATLRQIGIQNCPKEPADLPNISPHSIALSTNAPPLANSTHVFGHVFCQHIFEHY